MHVINSIFKDILVNIAASLMWVVLGIIFTTLTRFVIVRLPSRRLWALNEPAKLTISLTTESINTGQYERPSTGIGQVKALPYIIISLNTAYRKIDIRRILTSQEEIKHKIQSDIILLGGPKGNQVTAKFFDKINHLDIAVMSVEGFIHWKKER